MRSKKSQKITGKTASLFRVVSKMIGPRGRDEYFIRVITTTLTQLFCRHKTYLGMKQKVEIMFEVEETIVLRQGERIESEFCPQCRLVSVMIAPRAIAFFSGAKEREIFRLIEAGEIYFVEEDGVRVCLSCLNRCGSESGIAKRACETRRPQPQQQIQDCKRPVRR